MEQTPFHKGRSMADHLRDTNGNPHLSGPELARLGMAQIAQLATKSFPIQGFLRTCLLNILDALAKLVRNKKLWPTPIRKAYDDIRRLLKQADAQARVYGKDWAPPKTEDWDAHLKRMIGPKPPGMYEPHAHHILFKAGRGRKQKALVKEGQALLRKYGIDPIYGRENFVWAPNSVIGQHDTPALQRVVDQLKEVEKRGGSPTAIRKNLVEKLRNLGKIAADRR